MENLSMKLSSKTTKSIVSRLLTKSLCKKLGNDLILNINDFDINQDSGVVKVHADINAEIPVRTLIKLLESNLD